MRHSSWSILHSY